MGDEKRGIPECPLLRCIYDDPKGHYAREMRQLATEMFGLFRAGVKVPELAERYSFSRRTVFRYLALYKKTEAEVEAETEAEV